MTLALARSLLSAGALTRDGLARALLVSTTRKTSLVRALLATQALDPQELQRQLDRSNAPFRKDVAAAGSLVEQLPPGLCERLLALPTGREPTTGVVEVAVVDSNDFHALEEVAYWLKEPVRMVRTSLASLDAALRQGDTISPKSIRALAAPMSSERSGAATGGGPSSAVAPTGAAGPMSPAGEDDEPVLELTRRKRKAPVDVDGSDSEPAEVTQRGPFGQAGAPPVLADTEAILDKIYDARDRDAVLQLVVDGLRAVAHRVAVFANRREGFVGWTCTPELADRATLRSVWLPNTPTAGEAAASATILSAARAHVEARVVRVPGDTVHEPLVALMKGKPFSEFAVVGLRVEGRAIAVVVADGLWDRDVTLRRMDEIASAAGRTLGRLLRERRK